MSQTGDSVPPTQDKDREPNWLPDFCGWLHWILQKADVGIRNAVAPLKFIDGVTLATLVLGYIAWNTDKTLHDTLVAANRAWLAPGKIMVPPEFKITQERRESAAIYFYFQNVGKGPAININEVLKFDTIEMGKFRDDDFMKKKIIEMLDGQDCDQRAEKEKGRPIFPGLKASIGVDLEADKVAQAIDGKDHYILATGCLIYRTMDEIHRSEFCMILVKPDKSNAFEWQNALCGVHNRAT